MLSIIIPAYNEEKLIGSTIAAIHASCVGMGQEYEIIVADDASSDRTAEIAAKEGARVVACNNRKISATRNAGARVAIGNYLCFVDADTVINRSVIEGALDSMQSGAVGGGAPMRFDGWVPRWVKVALPITAGLFRLFKLTGGAFLFCKREVFDEIGGFDENVYASEEISMCSALKRKGRFVVLREEVITSGRKLRAYSGWEILRMMLWLGLRGPNAVKKRENTAFWYNRRDDPAPPC